MNEKYIKFFLMGVELIVSLYEISRTAKKRRR